MALHPVHMTPELYDYCKQVGFREHPALAAIRETNQAMPQKQMAAMQEVGQLLSMMVMITQAKRVLEIGTFTGYSTLSMALSLPEDGQVITCDKDAEIAAIAEEHWERAEMRDKITIMTQEAATTLQKLCNVNATFDLVFIDADKRSYDTYYEQSLRLMKSGGLMLIDNTLWQGKVADPNTDDKRAQALQAFNQKVFEDDRVDMLLLPMSDGVTLIRKR